MIKILDTKNLEQVLSLEWLVTNGLGGYASSTISGTNTRRYHGLLVAALQPPINRTLLFSRIDENLIINKQIHQLSTNQWKDLSISPQGYKLLEQFYLDPFPNWIYKVSEITLKKELILLYEHNTVMINYKISGNFPQVELELVLLVNHRDFHKETKGNSDWFFEQKIIDNGVIIQVYPNVCPLYIKWTKGVYQRTDVWYYNYFNVMEKKRGLPYIEDHYNTGILKVNLKPGESITIVGSTEEFKDNIDFYRSKENEINRLEKLIRDSQLPEQKEFRYLIYASDQFIVKRSSVNSKTIIAGYHWFSDWGRDTMISLVGLTLVTKRYQEARNILKTFASYIDRGLIPNRFPDNEQDPHEYNTVDATLWFFHAIERYVAYTKDLEFVQRYLYPKLQDIIEWHELGTRYSIKVDPQDYLITAGDLQTQLTWMDAKIGDWVVTPRQGKPVEINTLWYNALKTMEILSNLFNDKYIDYKSKAEKCKQSFIQKFWNPEKNCLYDYINEAGVPDSKIRPNQIFVVSLPHTILDPEKEKLVVNTVEKELLTPYGLRTLSPDDPDYKGIYDGDQYQRDSAYHQGTVWPWLMGHFVRAYLKVYGKNEETLKRARELIQPLLNHLTNQACIGGISEIFDGNPPHLPRGCINQAFSVAEILRCWVEDILDQYPKIEN